jgi:large subunit ribosomal protein L31e
MNYKSDVMDEKIYTINLRNAISKVPKWEKSKRSVAVVRKFLERHMKGDEVKIGKSITEEIWKGGNENPPKTIRIHAIMTEDEDENKIVKAELLGVPFPEEKEKKKEKKEEKAKEEGKKEETKPEEKSKEEPKKEDIKPEEKKQ